MGVLAASNVTELGRWSLPMGKVGSCQRGVGSSKSGCWQLPIMVLAASTWNTPTMTKLDAANGEGGSPLEFENRLAEIQKRWLDNEARRRELSDERLRLVWEAVDVGGLSLGMVARAMTQAGREVHRSDVSKMLASGYPEPG